MKRIIKFKCDLTIETTMNPRFEEEYEVLCKNLEDKIEKALEDMIGISTAEAILEEE